MHVSIKETIVTYLHIDIDYSYEHDITKKQSLEYRTIQH